MGWINVEISCRSILNLYNYNIGVCCVCTLPNSLCVQWQEVYDKGRALYTSHLTQLSPDNIFSLRLIVHLFQACLELSIWEEALKYSIQILEPYLFVSIIQLSPHHTPPHTTPHTQPSLWAPSSCECIPAILMIGKLRLCLGTPDQLILSLDDLSKASPQLYSIIIHSYPPPLHAHAYAHSAGWDGSSETVRSWAPHHSANSHRADPT